MDSSDKIELVVECSKCILKRKKPFAWLKEKHLPCPNCGTQFIVNNSHITMTEMKIKDALMDFNNINGTIIINLKL